MIEERAVRAFERIGDELAGIRALLEILATPVEEPTPACAHPAEQIADFGMTGGVRHWECKACGYNSLKEAA